MLIVNEISFMLTQKPSQSEARDLIRLFLNVHSRFCNLNPEEDDRLHISTSFDFINIPLANNRYCINNYRGDKEIDLQYRQKLNSLLNRSATLPNDIFDQEMKINEKSSLGGLHAFLSDGILISFSYEGTWNKNKIKGLLITIKENDILEQKEIELNNISTISTVEKVIQTVLDREKLDINTGEDLLAKAKSLFPNIVFCSNAVKELAQENSAVNTKQILKKLIIIQSSISKNGSLDDVPNLSPESDGTLKTYRKEHTFELPNGTEKVFSSHIRFTGNGIAGRIFLDFVKEEQLCYIAHVGCKLPNIQFPH